MPSRTSRSAPCRPARRRRTSATGRRPTRCLLFYYGGRPLGGYTRAELGYHPGCPVPPCRSSTTVAWASLRRRAQPWSTKAPVRPHLGARETNARAGGAAYPVGGDYGGAGRPSRVTPHRSTSGEGRLSRGSLVPPPRSALARSRATMWRSVVSRRSGPSSQVKSRTDRHAPTSTHLRPPTCHVTPLTGPTLVPTSL